MKVSAIMTPDPVTVPADASLAEALALMDSQDFRHLPVLDGTALIGVVSERDLLEALGRMPGDVNAEAPDVLASDRATTVREIVHREVRTVEPAEHVDVAAAVFLGLKIGCLPVTHDGVLEGIITEMDLLAAYELLCRNGRLKDDPTVEHKMTAKVTYVEPGMSLQDAFSTCLARGVRHLPVLDRGLIAGIVSDRDLRAAASSSHAEAIHLSDIMAQQVEVVDPDAPLSEAARRMVDQKITTLPVMRQDELVGMLSLSDVLAHCVSVMREV